MKIIIKPSQQLALDKLMQFVESPDKRIFILKGYAGTGKTTMLRMFVDELLKRKCHFKLLASTGRAAKIVCNMTDNETKTVHSQIYTFQDLNQDIGQIVDQRKSDGVDKSGQLLLNFELNTVNAEDKTQRLYIVDEASMISDKLDSNAVQAVFGNGKLLSDLLQYDPLAKFVFVGDECQLPPVGQNISPALLPQYFIEHFGLQPDSVALTEIVRQKDDNDLIVASKIMRDLYHSSPQTKWAKFPLRGYKNIVVYPNQTALLNSYVSRMQANGYNESTFICNSNKICDVVTSMIRPKMGIHGATLQKNDLLLVTQNNYITGLMNGDLVRVEEVGVREERAGLTFLKVSVKELFSNKVYTQLMVENVLYNNQTNLSQAEQKELFIDYYLRMKHNGIQQKSELFKLNMFRDPYLNALRAVYGYALTCHKSQGGEWNHVYLDIAKYVPGLEKPYVYQWMYTAMTRARVQLHVVDDWWVV